MENSLKHLTRDAVHYENLISEGDDFLKIQIYRLALKKYQKALLTHYDDELSNEKINLCKTLIASESKILLVIGGIALLVSMILLILLNLR